MRATGAAKNFIGYVIVVVNLVGWGSRLLRGCGGLFD